MLGIGGGAVVLLGGVGGWMALQGGGGGSLSYGASVQGEIVQGGPRDPFQNKLSASHTFSGSAGDSVRIDMESGSLDTYLILEGPQGGQVGLNDDGNPTGFLNSRLETSLPRDGEYTIWATTFNGSDTGGYSLSLTRL